MLLYRRRIMRYRFEAKIRQETILNLFFTKIHAHIFRLGLSRLFDAYPKKPNRTISIATNTPDQTIGALFEKSRLPVEFDLLGTEISFEIRLLIPPGRRFAFGCGCTIEENSASRQD
uniref:Uncharacterized protein n=1 Tax=Candidatus Kentrum sp. TC TaxID=2126339 RepID=A0A450YE12_9GAMM|nr:MAG: hypothetical protein BECKTC1821E_GA0114239_100516 [Candidatus Kentron sp. TC]VFK54285.1 MAG: hypothetical protein BECKTC1821F_GA0114240_1004108 [Candidatus Kentron sp. TC]